jgi:ABC-type Fe3+ transport system permease subunit
MTLAVAIFNFQDNGRLELVSALGVVMLALVTLVVAVVRRAVGGAAVPLAQAPQP